MASKVGYYSHEALNFPLAGSDGGNVSLPECDIFSSIPDQASVESSLYDTVFCEDGNLLTTSSELRFTSKPSLAFTDLGESYIFLEMVLVKDGAVPAITDADKVIVSNMISVVPFRDLQIFICGKPINSCFQNYLYECYLRVMTEISDEALTKW